MNREFDFIDLYYLNDITSEASVAQPKLTDEVIEISAFDEPENVVNCTYAKFLEILDTEGLEGLVNV